MKRSFVLLTLLALSSLPCFAAVSGTVTDLAGHRLTDVYVSLALAGTNTRSDTTGAWSLVTTEIDARNLATSQARWTGKAVELTLREPSMVSVEAYDLKGSLQGRLPSARLGAGSHHLPMALPGTEMAWLRVTVNGRPETILAGTVVRIGHARSLQSARSLQQTIAARSQGIVDTLLFQWRWQVVARIALANLDTSGMVTPIDTSLTGIFTDSRDKQPYKYVKLQSQTWMAQNLNYQSAGADSGWCYGNISANCDTYGRLYTWSAVMAGAASSTSNPSGVRGICPFGWHVPSDAEWTTLMGFTGGPGYAGAQLKSKTGWSPNDNGLDLYGFTGLPGGFRGYAETFGGLGNGGDFWSATENASNAWWRSLDANYPNMSRMDKDKIFGFSLRCVED